MGLRSVTRSSPGPIDRLVREVQQLTSLADVVAASGAPDEPRAVGVCKRLGMSYRPQRVLQARQD